MKTTRGFIDGDRYQFDFGPCNYAKGWAQIDTESDASYFGQWCNPSSLTIFAFVEGDTCQIQCDDAAEFVAELRRIRQWHLDNGGKCYVDTMCSPTIIGAFALLNCPDVIHPGDLSNPLFNAEYGRNIVAKINREADAIGGQA